MQLGVEAVLGHGFLWRLVPRRRRARLGAVAERLLGAAGAARAARSWAAGRAPRSQSLVQLLWRRTHGCSRSHCVCLDCTAPGMLVCYRPLANSCYYEKRPKPTERSGLLPKYFIPGRSRDLVERLDVSSRNVVERPV